MASQRVVHMSRQRAVPDPHDPAWSPRRETRGETAAGLICVAGRIRAIRRLRARRRTEEIDRLLEQASAVQP
jgi:hypothetical protein